MTSAGDRTIQRIFAAAQVEFAQFGLAGARVDRIASAANANKERMYAYFGDKRGLYTAALSQSYRAVFEAVPLDPSDLPDFVGRMFDYSIEHPEHLRMLDWARLEGALSPLEPDLVAVLAARRAAVAAAQFRGEISDGMDSVDLVSMLFALATSWSRSTEALLGLDEERTQAVIGKHRAAAVSASHLIVQQRVSGP